MLSELILKHIDSWLFQPAPQGESFFSSLIFIKFLRLIEEHYQNPELMQLRQREIQICLKIWRTNQEECYQIGSEILRIFFNVVKIPEFKPICDDLSRLIEGKPLSTHLYEKKGGLINGLNIFVQ